MARRRSCVGCIVVPIGVLAAAIVGGWIYWWRMKEALYVNPPAVPSVKYADPSPEWSEAVERARGVVRAGVTEQNLPGLSVAVGVGGDVAWAEGFGWADIKTRLPITPDTSFRIGTASTLLTSAAVGVLLEEGRLTLDDELQSSVPEFPKKQWPVTLRQLMGNVGGLGTEDDDRGPLSLERCESPIEALPYFADDALLFEPGTQYRHSKYGWILVSAALEAAAGQPFLRLMRERIFEPLGMDNTGAEAAAEENPDRVGGPEEDPPMFTFIRQVIVEPLLGMDGENGKPAAVPATIYAPGFGYAPIFRYGLHVMRPRNLSCYAGSVAFFSTPSDLVRFGLALNGGRLLQPSTVRLFQTSQQLADGQETGYGLGWELESVTLGGEPAQAAGLDGELLGGRVASVMMFREPGIVVAVMANRSYADMRELAVKVAEAFAEVVD